MCNEAFKLLSNKNTGGSCPIRAAKQNKALSTVDDVTTDQVGSCYNK